MPRRTDREDETCKYLGSIMTKLNWRSIAKGVGLAGAVLTGLSMCIAGDVMNGSGVIFAAFASAPRLLGD